MCSFCCGFVRRSWAKAAHDRLAGTPASSCMPCPQQDLTLPRKIVQEMLTMEEEAAGLAGPVFLPFCLVLSYYLADKAGPSFCSQEMLTMEEEALQDQLARFRAELEAAGDSAPSTGSSAAGGSGGGGGGSRKRRR